VTKATTPIDCPLRDLGSSDAIRCERQHERIELLRLLGNQKMLDFSL
jgi:hypothetical protein